MATYQIRENGGVTARIRFKGHIESRTFYPVSRKSAMTLAEEWVKIEEAKISDGNYKSEKKARTTTLSEALDIYENGFAKKLKGYSTEKYRIKNWRNWKYATNKLSELSESKFDEYRDDRRKSVKDASIRLEFAVITALFSNTQYGIDNPAKNTISTLSFADKRNRRFKKDEQAYLLDALFNTKCSNAKRANKYLPLVAIFGIETACRLSEIVADVKEHATGILMEHIHLDGEKSIAKIVDAKNGHDRYVPLSPIAVETINKAKELNPALTGPLFKTSVSAIKQGWQRAKKRAIEQYKIDCGSDKQFLENFHFHDLRHEAASRWKKYFGIHDLKDLTGHRDIRSLMRYLHSDEDDIKEMAGKMAKIQNKNRDDGDKKIITFPKKSKHES